MEAGSKELPGRKKPELKNRRISDEWWPTDPSCSSLNMAITIKVINQKLDLALSRFQEIDDLKVNLKDLQKLNKHRFKRQYLLWTQRNSKFHKGVIEALQIGV